MLKILNENKLINVDSSTLTLTITLEKDARLYCIFFNSLSD